MPLGESEIYELEHLEEIERLSNQQLELLVSIHNDLINIRNGVKAIKKVANLFGIILAIGLILGGCSIFLGF